METVTERSEVLAAALNGLRIGVAVLHLVDPERPESWVLTALNPAGGRLAGLEPERECGRLVSDISPSFLTSPLPRMLAHAARTGEPLEPMSLAYGDERIRRGFYRLQAFPLPLGRVGLTFEDVTRSRRKNEVLRASRDLAQIELRRRNDELARSNAELAQFASIASHDLQEPLNKVASFAEFLVKRAGPALDAECSDILRRMVGSVDWMRRLIQDLLSLSRVTTSDRVFEIVDLGDVARAAAEDLADLASRMGGKIALGPLPKMRGDPTQLRQLLVNLIGNALKFHRKDEAPVVVVWGHVRKDGFLDLVVADNGIGFEQKFAEKIMKPFQRLHSRAEYDGTGIGLAICARIALRHGGVIDARGAPGKGATFTVTLPTPLAPREMV